MPTSRRTSATVASDAPDENGAWLVIDADGRRLAVQAGAIDRRLRTLRRGQRLTLEVDEQSEVTKAGL